MNWQKSWLIALFIWLAAGFWLYPATSAYFSQARQEPAALAEETKASLLKLQPETILDLDDPYFRELPPSLRDAASLYPNPDSLESMNGIGLAPDCNSRLRTSDEADLKLRQWHDFVCSRAALPNDFFAHEPFISPFGGSWVLFAHLNRGQVFDRAWLKRNEARLHFFERIHFVESLEHSALKGLKLEELSYLTNLQSLVVSTERVFARDPDNRSRFLVYPRSSWNQLIAGSILDFGDFDPHDCSVYDGFQCWVTNERNVKAALTKIGVWLLGGILLLGWLIFSLARQAAKIRKQAQEDRTILVQTLAHELRHPVTGLRLSLEAFRNEFDRLPEKLQDEFLMMTSQVQKLQRLVHASEQYLGTSGQGPDLFQFKEVVLSSFNDYLCDLTESYREKIKIEPLVKDTRAKLDPYWYGMCVTNLVKNALIHGQRPIVVKAERKGAYIALSVTDSGKGLSGDRSAVLSGRPQESTAGGMGLGLSLVVRVVRLMKGDLKYEASPKPKFTVSLKVVDDENIAG